MTIFFSTMTGLLTRLCGFTPFQLFAGCLFVGGIFRLFWRIFAGSPEDAPENW